MTIIMTLDPNIWFSKYVWKYNAFTKALAANIHNTKILTVLALTSSTSKGFLAERSVLNEGMKRVRRPVLDWISKNAYYTICCLKKNQTTTCLKLLSSSQLESDLPAKRRRVVQQEGVEAAVKRSGNA